MFGSVAHDDCLDVGFACKHQMLIEHQRYQPRQTLPTRFEIRTSTQDRCITLPLPPPQIIHYDLKPANLFYYCGEAERRIARERAMTSTEGSNL